MSVYKRSKKCKLSYILLLLLLVLLAAIGVFCYQLSIHIDDMSRYESKLLATEIINSAIKEALSSENAMELITQNSSTNGAVTSLSLNPVGVNKVNNLISSAVTKKIKECEDKPFKVPVGTLSGITFLNGRGFDLSLRLHQLGSATTKIESQFESCGINQTKYSVYVDITVELSAVLPIKTTQITVEHRYLIGEKVIVGDIPQSYFSM